MRLNNLEVRLKTIGKGSVADVAEEVVRVVHTLRDGDDDKFTLVWDHTDGFELRFYGSHSDMTPAKVTEVYYQEKEKRR